MHINNIILLVSSGTAPSIPFRTVTEEVNINVRSNDIAYIIHTL
jgi:hypothetical protein